MFRKLAIVAIVLGAIGFVVYRALPSILYPYIDRPPMLPKLDPIPAVGSLSAVRCGGCHRAIYEEWSSSLMGQATTNPFFVAERGEHQMAFLCGRCHAPLENQSRELVTGLASLDPLVPIAAANPAFDEALANEGVTCVVCHMRAGDDRILNARVLSDANAPHGLLEELNESQCARCHQFDPIGANTDRPAIDTVGEHAAYRARGGEEHCTSCHMPAIERSSAPGAPVRSGHDHRFLGVRDGAFIARWVSASIERQGDEVAVEVENRAGHRVPTGEPGRVLLLRIELLGAPGPGIPGLRQNRPTLGHESIVSATRSIRILRDMDPLLVRDRYDITLGPGPLERRRLTVPFSRADLSAASGARVIVELARYEPAHPLVEQVGAERLAGVPLVAHVATATVSWTSN